MPKGELFLLGDNRSVSLDSRVHLQDAEQGAVPAGDVRGRVEATAWPLGRFGTIARTAAFDALPDGGASPQGPLRWIAAASWRESSSSSAARPTDPSRSSFRRP